jgi:hypothetical protein
MNSSGGKKVAEVAGLPQYIQISVQRKGLSGGNLTGPLIHRQSKKSLSSIISHPDEENRANLGVKEDL